MDFINLILLGILQGMGEFLPISSSGHLVVFGQLLNVTMPGIVFEVGLHLGTFFAVCIVFYKDVLSLIKEAFSFLKDLCTGNVKKAFDKSVPSRNLFLLVLVATIPTAIIGFILDTVIEGIYDSFLTVGISLLITSFLLLSTKKAKWGRHPMERLSMKSAALTGIIQGLAVFPGISRSGSTLFALSRSGISAEEAGKFSFIISLPAVFGAILLKSGDIIDTLQSGAVGIDLLIGITVSFVVGILSIKFLLKVLAKERLSYFGYYCAFAAVATLILHFVL